MEIFVGKLWACLIQANEWEWGRKLSWKCMGLRGRVPPNCPLPAVWPLAGHFSPRCSHLNNGNHDACPSYEKQMWKNESEEPWLRVARAFQTQIPFDLTLLLLGIHRQESSTAIQKNIRMKMFRAALLQIAKPLRGYISDNSDRSFNPSVRWSPPQLSGVLQAGNTQAIPTGWVHLNLCHWHCWLQ